MREPLTNPLEGVFPGSASVFAGLTHIATKLYIADMRYNARAVAVGAVRAVLAAATVYEALVALEVIHLGSVSGDGAPGEGVVFAGAMLAMLAGAALAVMSQVPGARLLAPSGAAFLLAHFYTFDPYYLPGLRRMSDQGLVAPWLVYCVIVLALVAGVLAQRRGPAGRLPTVAALLASALLSLFASAGH